MNYVRWNSLFIYFIVNTLVQPSYSKTNVTGNESEIIETVKSIPEKISEVYKTQQSKSSHKSLKDTLK